MKYKPIVNTTEYETIVTDKEGGQMYSFRNKDTTYQCPKCHKGLGNIIPNFCDNCGIEINAGC